MTDKDIEIYRQFQKSPIFFIEKMWGLTPERNNAAFIKGKHITWQQHDILLAVEKALRGEGSRRISVKSGHGIGKSTVLSWLIIWFLFCFKDAQIPCTAPTSEQMHDVLWKEINLWLGRMPEFIQKKYEWTAGYIRITERPETWFARARTARKEAPEALAGVHGDYVMFIVDEASGVFEEIFKTAEGALTNKNIFFIMISNPTRLLGYFYDSHHGDKLNWQTLGFSSVDSPIVDKDYVKRIIQKNGDDSDEYRIRVVGEFPGEEGIDDKGYVPLLTESDLRKSPTFGFIGTKKMGIDPAGEGKNETIWVVRDEFKARVVGSEKISNAKTIAQKTLTLMEEYEVDPERVWDDSFGVGADVAQEVALAERHYRINGVNVGDRADDGERFSNKRAEAYWRLRIWIRTGGELAYDAELFKQLLTIRYRRTLSGKIEIMGKEAMRKLGIESPDRADALMLTFVDEEKKVSEKSFQPKHVPVSDYEGGDNSDEIGNGIITKDELARL